MATVSISREIFATYQTSRPKILVVLVVFAALAYAFYEIVDPHLTTKDHHKYLFVACFMIALLPWSLWGGFLRKPFRLEATDAGMYIWNLGFFYWDQIILEEHNNRLVAVVPTDISADDSRKTPMHIDLLILEADSNPPVKHLILNVGLPSILTNVSRRDFLKAIAHKKSARQQTVTLRQPNMSFTASADWKTKLFGENPTTGKVIGTSIVLLLMLSGIYVLMAGDFIIVKSRLQSIINWIAFLAGIIGTGLIIKNRHKNPKLAEVSRLKLALYVPLFLAVLPFLAIWFFIMPFVAPFHYLTGHDYVSAIFYEGKSGFGTSKSCGYSHRLKSDSLDMPAMKDICLPDELYEQMPETGILFVKGRESLIARSVHGIALPKDDFGPVSERQGEIKAMWADYQ